MIDRNSIYNRDREQMAQVERISKAIEENIFQHVLQCLEPWVEEVDLVESITENTNLITDLGLDSVAILQLILQIEKEYGIRIGNDELDSDIFSSMKNIITLIKKKIHENN